MNKSESMKAMAIALISIIFFLGCVQPEPEKTETITIGYFGPLSGAVAYTGEPVKNGFELAHSQKSTFNGKNIEVMFEDDKCSTEQAVTIAKKFFELNDIKVIVSGVCSSSTLGVAPVAQEKRFVLVSPVAASPTITDAGEYIFRISASSNLMAANAARILSEKGYSKVGIVYELNDYPVGWKDAFGKEFRGLGGEIIIEESFNSADTDVKTQLLKVKEKNPEIVLLTVVSAPPAIMLLKQAKELDMGLPILGNEVFSFKSVIASNPEASGGMFVTTYSYDLDSAEMKQFLSDYKEKYGKDITEEIYGALGYDLYNLLYDAISACNGDSPECIKNYLNNVGEINGVGGKFALDEKGDAVRSVVLRRVVQGRLEIME